MMVQLLLSYPASIGSVALFIMFGVTIQKIQWEKVIIANLFDTSINPVEVPSPPRRWSCVVA